MPNLSNPIAYSYHQIEDLPPNWEDLCQPDLHQLHSDWLRTRENALTPDNLTAFLKELGDLWAIETGHIEGLTPDLRGKTVTLAKAGLERMHDAQFKLSAQTMSHLSDQEAALRMLMDLVGKGWPWTESAIREIHETITRNQPSIPAITPDGQPHEATLIKGAYKTEPNNPLQPDGTVHEYCPPLEVAPEMRNLLRWHREHQEQQVCVEIQAAWLHHRFTQIHPFQDGNGRVARALASALFMKEEYLLLVIRNDAHRDSYINALQQADQGDLRPLVELFSEIQMQDLRDAMEAADNLASLEMDALLSSAVQRGMENKDRMDAELKRYLHLLVNTTERIIQSLDLRLNQRLSAEQIYAATAVQVSQSGDQSGDDGDRQEPYDYWWRMQVVAVASEHGYFADLRRPRRWVSWALNAADVNPWRTHMVISFHGVGRFQDEYAADAFLTYQPYDRHEAEPEREPPSWETIPLAERELRFSVVADALANDSSRGSAEQVSERLKPWLNGVLRRGLELWQRGPSMKRGA